MVGRGLAVAAIWSGICEGSRKHSKVRTHAAPQVINLAASYEFELVLSQMQINAPLLAFVRFELNLISQRDAHPQLK